MKTRTVFIILSLLAFQASAKVHKNRVKASLSPMLVTFNNDIYTSPLFALHYERKFSSWSYSFFAAVGTYAGYQQIDAYGQTTTNSVTSTLEVIGGRLNYYFYHSPKIDIYGGIMLAYVYVDGDVYLQSQDVHDPNNWTACCQVGTKPATDNGGIKPGFQLGTNIWFSPHFGIMGELGYGLSILNAGIIYRY